MYANHPPASPYTRLEIPNWDELAWQGLVGSLHVKKGESVLIRGGTSSVGLATAELARLYGVTVYSTTRSAEKAKKLAERVGGAEHVILDDGNVAEQVLKRTRGKGVDHCIELVGSHKSLKDSARALKPDGKLCMVGILSTAPPRHTFPLLGIHVNCNFKMENGRTKTLNQWHCWPLQRVSRSPYRYSPFS
jgi:NADPH:quinone reductase-like Zn-dependent oxidoreductase